MVPTVMAEEFLQEFKMEMWHGGTTRGSSFTVTLLKADRGSTVAVDFCCAV